MRAEAEIAAIEHGPADTAVTSWTWLDRQLNGCERSSCPIDLLLPADSPRLSGESEDHVRLLAESPSPLPPILVHRPSRRVIDGMHRLAAAKLRGDSEIEVIWYDGDERDAFALAVQSNVSHGLPLSLADRREAAIRIIHSHPDWSDRLIASIVNLAASTVGAIRLRSAAPTAPAHVRIGRDGRARSVDTGEARRLAGRLLQDNPKASLREIAKSTGLAPSTVLDVRKRLSDGRDPVPSRQGLREATANGHTRREPRTTAPPIRYSDYTTALASLKRDPSLRYNDIGRMLVLWLRTGPVDVPMRAKVVEQLPPHCLEVIRTLAHAHATAWQEFALQLENRSAEISQSV
ncbi:ParB/RepB/Spo0J family partition protein [Actinomadura monticuli]|uniref:Winged helix-turn-helix transcriptional regulator n=1 Tax=Actinomadura monticuli TaxID=3097367 RepID=A0ABV4Q4W1_9ACTN